MELYDLLLLGLFCTVISAVFSVIFAYGVAYFRDNALSRRISVIEADLENVELTVRGARGNAKQVEYKQADAALMARVAAGIQAGKPIPEVLKEVMASDPETAMRLAKKFGIGI